MEHPITTLEEDLLQMLTGNYKNYHYGVSLVQGYLDTQDLNTLLSSSKTICDEISPYLHSKFDLNTLCKVLLADDKKEQAMIVATLNTNLFPEEISVYETLANIQGLTNKKEDAIKSYKKALEIDPDRADLKYLMEQFIDELKAKN